MIGNDIMQEVSTVSGHDFPKLTINNVEGFELYFQGDAWRKVFMSGVPLGVLLCPNYIGSYYVLWNSIEDKLNNCVVF